MFVRKNGAVELLIFAALLLAVALVCRKACAQAPQSKPADRVSGVVINSVTREPIARALVVSEGERFATLTDSSGRFEFVFADDLGSNSGSGPGNPASSGNIRPFVRPYMLTARKPGFLNGQNEHASSGQRVVDGKDIEIALVPEALIVGHVALPTSEAPDPIEVELFRRQVRQGRAHWVSAGVQSTRSDGEFRFAELSAGSYKLLTHELRDEDPKYSVPGGQAYGYAPVYYPNVSGFSSRGAIQLTAGQKTEANLTLARQPYFPVIVPVTNVPPGKGFGIDVSVQGPGGPGYTLEYDGQKQAIVGLLPNGGYRLRVVSFGDEASSGEANVTVHSGAEGVVLPLSATPPIRVNVKDQFNDGTSQLTTTTVGPQGQMISQQLRFSVTVTLEPADDFGPLQQNGTQARLDSQNDSTQIEHVPPGRYWVQAQVYPINGYAASMTAGGVDLLHHPLVVPAGSSAPAIEVTLRNDTATIEGVVEGANNLTGPAAPISLGGNGWGGPPSSASSARVYFIPVPDSTGRFAEQFVGSDTKFSVMLPPGAYRVLAFPQVQPDLEYENPVAMRAYDGKGQVVRLAAGQKEQMQLQLVSTSE
jgi:hypothetical protein